MPKGVVLHPQDENNTALYRPAGEPVETTFGTIYLGMKIKFHGIKALASLERPGNKLKKVQVMRAAGFQDGKHNCDTMLRVYNIMVLPVATHSLELTQIKKNLKSGWESLEKKKKYPNSGSNDSQNLE